MLHPAKNCGKGQVIRLHVSKTSDRHDMHLGFAKWKQPRSRVRRQRARIEAFSIQKLCQGAESIRPKLKNDREAKEMPLWMSQKPERALQGPAQIIHNDLRCSPY